MNSKFNLVRIIDILFNGSVHIPEDFTIYYDFFRYSYEEKSMDPFKLRELSNWLLDNNIQLKNEFYGDKTPRSYRAHKKKTLYKSKIKSFN